MEERLHIENYIKFIILIANRIDKTQWYNLPLRTRNVFYNYPSIGRWLVKATDREKMFFLEDLGFSTAIVVYPNNDCSISDIPELSEYFFEIENRIKSVERQLEKKMFCICTREVATYFYNMSQNSHSDYFGLKQNFKLLKEVKDVSPNQKFASASQYNENKNAREGILKFVSNILSEFNNNIGELTLQHKYILLSIREYNQVGVKLETIVNFFKGSIQLRQVHNYLAFLLKQGYINRTGKKMNTIYMLSSRGIIYINDYCDRVMTM